MSVYLYLTSITQYTCDVDYFVSIRWMQPTIYILFQKVWIQILSRVFLIHFLGVQSCTHEVEEEESDVTSSPAIHMKAILGIILTIKVLTMHIFHKTDILIIHYNWGDNSFFISYDKTKMSWTVWRPHRLWLNSNNRFKK